MSDVNATASGSGAVIKQMLRQKIVYLAARGTEATSYAGVAGVLLALHVGHADGWAAVITSIGVGVCSAIAILLPERG